MNFLPLHSKSYIIIINIKGGKITIILINETQIILTRYWTSSGTTLKGLGPEEDIQHT